MRHKWRSDIFMVFIAVLIVMFSVTMAGCGAYDSGYKQAEYQLKFITQDGTPVQNIQLLVKNRSGNINYGYPVTDYYAGNIPTSDANGVVTFHHVTYFLEWGGIFFFACKTGGPPHFDLVFTKDDKIIYNVKFYDLDRKVSYKEPTVTSTVSVYDKSSAAAAWSYQKNYQPVVVKQTLEFRILNLNIVVP